MVSCGYGRFIDDRVFLVVDGRSIDDRVLLVVYGRFIDDPAFPGLCSFDRRGSVSWFVVVV